MRVFASSLVALVGALMIAALGGMFQTW